MMSRSRRQGRGLGRRAAHLGALAGLSLLVACGDNDGPATPADMGGGGDMTTVEPQKEPATIKSLGTVNRPTAAALDKDGKNVYVLGYDQNGAARLFTTPSSGGNGTFTPITTTIPLAQPVALAIDGNNQLYIADIGTDDGGAVYKGTLAGALSVLGTGVFAPAGIAVSKDGADVYVTGQDKSGAPGLFKMSAAGGNATVAAMGAPFSNPSGVTFGPDGALYVLDSTAISPTEGAVLKVNGSAATTFSKTPLKVGFSTGIAPSGTDKLLLTSNAPGAAGVFNVASDGTVAATALTGLGIDKDGDPATVARAAATNAWVVLDTATPPQNTAGLLSGAVLYLTP